MNFEDKIECNNCTVLKQQLEDGEKESSLNFSTLKQKIISTDLLIQKYVEKTQENNNLSKRLDDLSIVVDQLRRDCSKYEEDLEKSLKESEPLRKAWNELVDEREKSCTKLQTLHDKLAASEKLVQQYEMLLKQKEEKEKEFRDYQYLQKEMVKKEKLLEKAKDDSVNLHHKLQQKNSELKRVTTTCHRAMEHLVKFGDSLSENGILAKGDKKILLHHRNMLMKQKTKNGNSSDDDDDEGAGKALENMFLDDRASDMPAADTSGDTEIYMTDTSDTEKQNNSLLKFSPKKSTSSLQDSPKRRTSPRKHHNSLQDSPKKHTSPIKHHSTVQDSPKRRTSPRKHHSPVHDSPKRNISPRKNVSPKRQLSPKRKSPPKKHEDKNTSPKQISPISSRKKSDKKCIINSKDVSEDQSFKIDLVSSISECNNSNTEFIKDQGTFSSVQSENSSHCNLSNLSAMDYGTNSQQDSFPNENKVCFTEPKLAQQQENGDNSLPPSSELLSVSCGEVANDKIIEKQINNDDQTLMNSSLPSVLCEDTLQDANENKSEAETIDKTEVHLQTSLVEADFHSVHILNKVLCHTNIGDENHSIDVVDAQCNSHSNEVKESFLTQGGIMLNEVFTGGNVPASKSVSDNINNNNNNNNTSNASCVKEQAAHFEALSNVMNSNKESIKTVNNYPLFSKEGSESYDNIINELDMIRSQMCLQAECLSPLSPLPPTPPPSESHLSVSHKSYFHTNQINRNIQISSHCKLPQDDNLEVSLKQSFDSELRNANMHSSNVSSPIKKIIREDPNHLSNLKQCHNNKLVESSINITEKTHESRQFLSHQKSEGFEVSENSDATQKCSSDHSKDEQYGLLYSPSKRAKDPVPSHINSYTSPMKSFHNFKSQSPNPSPLPNTCLKANFAHNAKDGLFQVSVRLPIDGTDHHNSSVTSFCVEVDTETKEFTLSWRPKPVETNSGIEKQIKALHCDRNFSDEAHNIHFSELYRTPEKNENITYNSTSSSYRKQKHVFRENSVCTNENLTSPESTKKSPLLHITRTAKLKADETLSTNHLNSPVFTPCTDQIHSREISTKEEIQKCQEVASNLSRSLESIEGAEQEHLETSQQMALSASKQNSTIMETSLEPENKICPLQTNEDSTLLNTSISSPNFSSPVNGEEMTATPCAKLNEANAHINTPSTLPDETNHLHSHEQNGLTDDNLNQNINNNIDTANDKSENLKRALFIRTENKSMDICNPDSKCSGNEFHKIEPPVKKQKIDENDISCTMADVNQPSNKKDDSSTLVHADQHETFVKSNSFSQSRSNHHFWRNRHKNKTNYKLQSYFDQLDRIKDLNNDRNEVINNIVCMIANPICMPSAKDAVISILEHLKMSQSNPLHSFLENNNSPPILSNTEHCLIAVLLHLDKKHKNHLQHLISSMQIASLSQIFSGEKLSLYSIASLCRIYTALCRQQSNIVKPRILCYDLLYLCPTFASFLIAAVVGVWPEVLLSYRNTKSTKNPLQKVLIYYFFKKTTNLTDKHQKQCKYVLSQLCHITESLISDPTSMAKELLEDLKEQTQKDVFEFIKALELLAAREGWEWTNDILVRSLLWPLFQKWSMKQQNPQDQIITDSEAAALVRLLGSLGRLCPKEKQDGLQNMVLTLQMLLIRSNEVAFCVQEAAFSSLLHLLPYSHSLVLPVIDSWISQNESQLSEENTRQLLEITMTKMVLSSLGEKKQTESEK